MNPSTQQTKTGGTRRRPHGLTLVELLTTLSVALVGLSLAIPAMTGLTSDRQVSGTVERLTADMTLARAEAIRRGQPVVICSSRDGETCSGSTDWAEGWILLVAPEGANGPAERIRVAPAAGTGQRLGGSHAQVVYRPDGTSTAL
ncbi:MAG: GspH/FimT family pseudopilin [Chromatiaceae bacterium]|jgi:prepilin-type N-terminal cleavage/methylation domain-containing protein|nr:GspH/FimT family pseudopilin [Chromatiaceae bacterium]